jgi:antitoxin component YwqK of YwqJK toxin-antitoxin module
MGARKRESEMKRPKSDVPVDATEVDSWEYGESGTITYVRVTECVFNGQVVGLRAYDSDGNLRMETPLKDNRKHGREYVWDESGNLESTEPYVNGQIHGLAKQYGRKGRVIGTYRFVHGTGHDIWRHENEDGSIGIAEIFTVRDGVLHGYEWWVNLDQRSVWHERHWQHGKVHGIERMWNKAGRFKRGYPKYWIRGEAVNKRVYLKAVQQDKTLPEYRETEDRPRRRFPAEIDSLLLKKGGR